MGERRSAWPARARWPPQGDATAQAVPDARPPPPRVGVPPAPCLESSSVLRSPHPAEAPAPNATDRTWHGWQESGPSLCDLDQVTCHPQPMSSSAESGSLLSRTDRGPPSLACPAGHAPAGPWSPRSFLWAPASLSRLNATVALQSPRGDSGCPAPAVRGRGLLGELSLPARSVPEQPRPRDSLECSHPLPPR